MLTSIKWTKDRHGCVTDPLSQPLEWHTLNELRFKPYGAVCVRTDGFMAEKEAGQFHVGAQPEKTQLTVVLLPATGTWLDNVYDRDWTTVSPEDAAEARNVSFAGDDCVFEKDAGYEGTESGKAGKKDKKVLLKFGSDGKVIMTADGGLCAVLAP